MELGLASAILIGMLFLGLASGIPVALVLLLAGTTAFFVGGGVEGVRFLGSMPWQKSSNFELVSIPLFVLMGHLLEESRFVRHLFRMLAVWLTWVPGSLGVVSLLTGGMFAAMSGSGVAAAATLGTVVGSEVRQYGYHPRLMLGVLSGGASLAPVIPPSTALIIYSSLTDQSVTRLFAAGVVPGLIVMSMMIAYVVALCSAKPAMAPRAPTATWKERLASLWALPASAAVIFPVLGGLFLGWYTPTESAAIGVVVGFGFLVVGCRAKWEVVFRSSWRAARNGASTAAFILILLVSGAIYSHAMTFFGLPQLVGRTLSDLSLTTPELLVALTILLLVLGCFIDSVTMQIITVPFLLPLLLQMGVDLIFFGVFVVLMVEIGTMTPPFGIHLFVLQGVMKASFRDAVLGALPFVAVWMAMIAVIILFPGLATWLPDAILGKARF